MPDLIRGFYDYEAKYESGETKKIDIDDRDLKEEIKNIAIKAFSSHGCRIWEELILFLMEIILAF